MKNHGVSPSEAWGLDYSELLHLLDIKNDDQDLSFMLTCERKDNGAPAEITGGLFQ